MPSWPGVGGVGGTPTTAQYSTLSSTACPRRGYGVATVFLPHTHTTPRYVRTLDRPLPEQLHKLPPHPFIPIRTPTHSCYSHADHHSTAHHSAETGRYERHEDRAPGPPPPGIRTLL
ncbi:hypothetical protein O988_08617 [Pseudogymnoascus sp. VKM F-3808]|nr:hypothetical protein O988_08617 [Pseudogymnoascus sp. VKM F-3808]